MTGTGTTTAPGSPRTPLGDSPGRLEAGAHFSIVVDQVLEVPRRHVIAVAGIPMGGAPPPPGTLVLITRPGVAPLTAVSVGAAPFDGHGPAVPLLLRGVSRADVPVGARITCAGPPPAAADGPAPRGPAGAVVRAD